MKHLVTRAPVITYYNPNEGIIIHFSPEGLGVALLQEKESL